MWTVYSALKMKVVALLMGILLNLYNENVCLYSLKENFTEWIKTLTSLLRSCLLENSLLKKTNLSTKWIDAVSS